MFMEFVPDGEESEEMSEILATDYADDTDKIRSESRAEAGTVSVHLEPSLEGLHFRIIFFLFPYLRNLRMLFRVSQS